MPRGADPPRNPKNMKIFVWDGFMVVLGFPKAPRGMPESVAVDPDSISPREGTATSFSPDLMFSGPGFGSPAPGLDCPGAVLWGPWGPMEAHGSSVPPLGPLGPHGPMQGVWGAAAPQVAGGAEGGSPPPRRCGNAEGSLHVLGIGIPALCRGPEGIFWPSPRTSW